MYLTLIFVLRLFYVIPSLLFFVILSPEASGRRIYDSGTKLPQESYFSKNTVW